jgi:chromosome segregation ATPase
VTLTIMCSSLHRVQKANEQTNKIESLMNDAARLRNESAEMKDGLSKLPKLEKTNAILFKDKSSLLEQVGKLSMELKAVKDSYAKANKELETFKDKLSEAQKYNIDIKGENSKLVTKLNLVPADTERAQQASQAASALNNENAQLKATIEDLKVNQAAHAVGGTQASSKVMGDYQLKVKNLESQKADLQKSLEEWTTLAKVGLRSIPRSDHNTS